MRCWECGAEYNQGQEQCPVCKAPLNQVKVMSPEEREQFSGITIEQQEDKEHFTGYSQDKNRIYFRHVSFGSGSSVGLLTKLIIAAGIVALILFVALPVMVLLGAAALVGWFFLRRFR